MNSHKDLIVWQKAMSLVEDMYSLTKGFPEEEKYGFTAQLRRASVSIPSNISEGAARNGKKEFEHFLYIGLGSVAEVETQLHNITEIRRMIQGLIGHLISDKD